MEQRRANGRVEAALPEGTVHLDADGLDGRAFNRALREAAAGHEHLAVHNPRARHNLAVALDQPVHVVFLGSVGYYCGGFNTVASLEIFGNAGWGLGEAMAGGRILVHGNTAWAAGASMRGGVIVIEGSGGPRTGVAMKGGDIFVAGSVGFMSGFMAHRGKLVVLGGAGDALGASMYEGRIYVGGDIGSLGADAVERPMSSEEATKIAAEMASTGLAAPQTPLRKIVAEGRLWYFDKRDAALWRAV
jgi:methylamine---glutamate N-methyltransferase subunit B